MPLRGVRYRSKRISKTKYLRLAFRGNTVVESVVKRYRHPSLAAEALKEHREHPWTTFRQARRIALDHRRKRKKK